MGTHYDTLKKYLNDRYNSWGLNMGDRIFKLYIHNKEIFSINRNEMNDEEAYRYLLEVIKDNPNLMLKVKDTNEFPIHAPLACGELEVADKKDKNEVVKDPSASKYDPEDDIRELYDAVEDSIKDITESKNKNTMLFQSGLALQHIFAELCNIIHKINE